MKEFSWKVFSVTGSIDSYLLYREMETADVSPDGLEEEDEAGQEIQPPIS
ncbi:YqzL family protein [Alteribacter natronophilus]|nr:YqzL family protein [Alteribacter natronophilus]TMW73850.1 YqzL family protein [Alteribacter natronophilus]